MKEFTELLEHFWFVKDNDSTDYFRIRRAIDDKTKRFLNESVGWNMIVNHKIVKLEKIPAKAYPFMGIQSFDDKKDYCLFCALLIFLDGKMESEQFLLTEMIESMEKIIGNVIDVDFTRFTDRKSLVKVLKFAQNMSLIVISDGTIDNLESDRNKQILYENTGLCAYFSVNHSKDIFHFQNYRDFENQTDMYLDNDTGYARTNRVYRKLLLQPAVYWESKNDTDSIYLKNQRKSIEKNLNHYLDGRLDIHNGCAFYLLDEDHTFGKVHPSESMLSGFATMVCAELRNTYAHFLPYNDTHKYYLETTTFDHILLECKKKFESGLGKQLRELSDDKFTALVTDYFCDWQFLEKTNNGYFVCDGIYKTAGKFPEDYQLSD